MAEPNVEGISPNSVLAAIRVLLPGLAPSDAKVALYLIESPNQVIFQSVSEVGLAAGTASSTVVRCAQQLGFRGFQDLKISLARELGPAAGSIDGAAPGAGVASVLDQVMDRAVQAVRSASRTVDPSQFALVVRAIDSADRVLFAGIGTSAPIAQDAAFRMRVIGVPADAPVEIYAQQMQASALAAGDVLLAVSHTGSTRHTVSCAERAREAGATTVALTSFARSPLTEASDHPLVAGTGGPTVEMEAMASRIAHIAIIDALLLALTAASPERARRHREVYEQILGEHRF